MKKITFRLPAEALGNATGASLLGDFNEWNLDKAIGLNAQPDGTFAASVELEPGKSYEYRFLLNNGTWINDWSAEQYVYNQAFGVENSLVVVTAESEKAPATAKKTAKKAAPKKTTASTKKAKTAPSKDDLTKIEGIGPKIAKLLEAEEIKTYAALGKTTAKKLKAILEAAGPKFLVHNPASWPKQAKLASAEKWDELKALQDKLLGGK